MIAVHLLPEDGNGRRYVDKVVAVLTNDTTYRNDPNWIHLSETVVPAAQIQQLFLNPSIFYLEDLYKGTLARDYTKK